MWRQQRCPHHHTLLGPTQHVDPRATRGVIIITKQEKSVQRLLAVFACMPRVPCLKAASGAAHKQDLPAVRFGSGFLLLPTATVSAHSCLDAPIHACAARGPWAGDQASGQTTLRRTAHAATTSTQCGRAIRYLVVHKAPPKRCTRLQARRALPRQPASHHAGVEHRECLSAGPRALHAATRTHRGHCKGELT